MSNRKTKLETSDDTNIVTLNPTEVTDLIAGLYQADAYDRTPMFLGQPGLGKTASIRAAVDKLRETYPDFGYEEINPTMPPEEVCGLPDLVRTPGQRPVTIYALPDWWPTDPNSKGIICLDDMAQGDKMMQTTLANVIQAKNLRGVPLPKGWMIVATGNRAEDNAGSNKLLSHIADRMTRFNVEACSKTWINDFALPNGVDDRIIAYIQQYPDALNQFNPKADKCPTSRTWAALSTRMAYIDSLKDTPNHEKFAQAIIIGELGMGEGCKFWAFCGLWGRTPNVEDILANPTTASTDYDMDIRYATAVALAKRMTPDNMGAALTYMQRVDSDMTAMVVKLGCRENPTLKDSDAYETWCMGNQELVCGVIN